jgi:hypothetical protein
VPSCEFSGRLVDFGDKYVYDIGDFIAPLKDNLTEACINGFIFPNNLL